jgi:hypothetical protein
MVKALVKIAPLVTTQVMIIQHAKLAHTGNI